MAKTASRAEIMETATIVSVEADGLCSLRLHMNDGTSVVSIIAGADFPTCVANRNALVKILERRLATT